MALANRDVPCGGGIPPSASGGWWPSTASVAELTVSRISPATPSELGLDRIEVWVPQAHAPDAEAKVDFGKFQP